MRSGRLLTLLAMMVMSPSVPAASAQGSEPPQYTLQIEPQSLSSALQAFAAQSGVQIIFFAKVTDGYEAPSLKGRYTVEDALARLLKGSDLTFREMNANTVAVDPQADSNKVVRTDPGKTVWYSNAMPAPANGSFRPFPLAPSGSSPPSRLGPVSQPGARESGMSVADAAPKSTPDVAGEVPDGVTALQEIIVTARHQSETEQRTALAIQVLTGETLQSQGISQPLDLSKLVPGLRMTNGAQTSIYIRGVGENSANANSQSAVAFNVDGVYVGRTSGVVGNFYDLARVEVVKGPQGTLYGRNATGGSLNLITQKPTGDFGGYVIGEAGDYDLRRVTAALNVPVTDSVAMRGAFYNSTRSGYLSDGTQDEDQLSARIHTLWTPNADMSFLWTVDTTRLRGEGDGSQYGESYIGASASPQALAFRRSQGLAILAEVPFREFRNFNTSGQLDWRLGSSTLTVVPGYRYQDFTYGSPSVLNSLGKADQYSVEARLARETRNFKYVVGVYSFAEKTRYEYQILQYQGFNLNSYIHVPDMNIKSKAVFGEGTYSLTGRSRITAGLRQTHETRDITLYNTKYSTSFLGRPPELGFGVGIDPTYGVANGSYSFSNIASRTFDNTSGKLGWEYDLRPASMLYATVATGFKSGGFTYAPAPDNSFEPEKLTAYTLGVKNRFFDNTLQANLELFDWHYANQQISHTGFDTAGAANFLTHNAGKSRIRGVELDTQWHATESDTLNWSLQYLWAYIEQYGVIVPAMDTSGCAFTPTVWQGRAQLIKDCSGFRLPFTPEWSGTLGYEHSFLMNDRGSLRFRAFVQFATSQYLDTNRNPAAGQRSAAHAVPDFDLTYRTPDDKVSVMGYVRNATDEFVRVGANSTFIPWTNTARPPRTFGVQFRTSF